LAQREPVLVPARRNGFFPEAFIWRGQRHEVSAVVSCSTQVRRGWRGHVQSHHFRVRSQGRLYELTQDLAQDAWHLEPVE
jgi:hypothetical protein